jgi:hypothetical protein
MRCLKCGGDIGTVGIILRCKSMDCEFEWIRDLTFNLEYCYRGKTGWSLVPSGCLGIFGGDEL